MSLSITCASSPEDLAHIRELFLEYAESLGFSLCFQGFDKELASLPGFYAPPRGRLLLARWSGQLAGCVALKPLPDSLGPNLCEMKRLYVRPAMRGHSIGCALAGAVIAAARDLGYSRMMLDTVPGKMDAAIAMYRRLGFRETAPYTHNPVEGAIFMALDLTRVHTAGEAP